MQVIFSNNAYKSILKETYSHSQVETGGIFLGHFENNTWYVIEMIDPGYENITREYAYFEYDRKYVEHLTNIKSREYKKQLLLLGLWHRHPSSMDTFSSTDDGTNIKFAKINSYGAISALVNLDPDFRLTVYHIENKTSLFNTRPNYTKLLDVKYGDEFIPNHLLEKYSIDDYLKSTHTVSYKENKSENKSVVTIDKDIQNKILDALDIELDYLESQTEYSYDIEPFNNEDISLNIILKNNNTKSITKFKLLYKDENIYCEVDDITKLYQKEFIENYLNQQSIKKLGGIYV